MDSDRFQHVAAIFEHASSLPPDERPTYLDRECNGDDDLRSEVERLLDSDESPHRVFDAPPTPARHVLAGLTGVAQAGANHESASLPESIGPYEIVSRLGVGGMGAVYLAKQKSPNRLIALKVIRSALAQPELLGRFQTEAQALALLKHPGIAQIYEAGAAQTDVGEQPYLAMEYVDGAPLTAYASENNLTIEARLQLMLDICDAVHHAHQRGVLHRDLKPGNILIESTDDARAPVPRILDFGVARIAADDGTATASGSHTYAGQIIGTLAYMSPEQAGGDTGSVNERSDVYALGVMMYELLGGERPLNVETESVTDAVRMIREVEPRSLGELDRQLRGDLETIVATAMAKEPERRYAGAESLASDIRRHLNNEPILARPASTFYQIRKFARRNRTPLIVIGLLVLLVGSAATLGVMMGRGFGSQTSAADDGIDGASTSKSVDGIPPPSVDWSTYVANIATAETALINHDVSDAIVRLKDAPEAHRNWEWRHLQNRIDRSAVQLGSFANGVHALATDARGFQLAIGDGAGGIRICDADTGQTQLELDSTLTSRITALSFDDTGKRLAAGGAGGEVLIFTAASTEPPIRLSGHTDEVTGIAWDADGQHLITASRDQMVRRWDIDARAERQHRNLGAGIRSMAHSRQARRIVVTDRNHAHVLDMVDLNEVVSFEEEPSAIWSSDISDNGLIVLGHFNGEITVRNIDDPLDVHRWKARETTITSVAFDSTGGVVIAGGGPDVAVWHTHTGHRLATYLGHANVVDSLAVIASDWMVSGSSREGKVRIWSQESDTVGRFTGPGRDAMDIATSLRGNLAAATQGQHTHVWDVAQRQLLHTITTSPSEVHDIEFTPDGKELWLFNLTSNKIERRRADNGVFISEIDVPDKPYCFDIAPDGRTMALGYLRNGEVVVMDAVTGKTIETIEAHLKANVLSVRFSPDGEFLVSCGSNGMAQVWNATTYQSVAAVKSFGQEFMHADFSKDGRLLATATAGEDNDVIQLWSTDTWNQVALLKGHTNQINRVAFLSGDTRLASVSHDQTLRLWDVPSGRLAATLHGHQVCIWSMGVVADGAYIVTGGGDYSVRFWDG